MRPLKNTVPRALAVLAAAVTLAAFGIAPTGAAPDATQARAVAKPAVGSCHALSTREAPQPSDPDAPVSCERPHTGRTFAVPSVPRRISMKDVAALQRFVDRTCEPAYFRAVSRSREQRLLSAYSYVWFTPTPREVRRGARWVRCDVVIYGGAGSLVPLPPAQAPALRTAPHPDREARCYTGRRAGFRVTACSRPHQYRARAAYQLPRGAYPSDAQFLRTGQRRCAPVAGRQWSTFNPTRSEWQGGFRWVVCTTRTTR